MLHAVLGGDFFSGADDLRERLEREDDGETQADRVEGRVAGGVRDVSRPLVTVTAAMQK